MTPTAFRIVCGGWILLLAGLHGAAHAGRLNDTGQVNCYSASALTGSVSPATPNGGLPDPRYARQDCTRGLAAADAMGALSKTGASSTRGRDYSKIANNGSTLPATAALGSAATDWACTRDNLTGLIWEIKTSDTGARDFRKTFLLANAGAYAAAVNTVALCGYTDWRLPTLRELISLIDANTSSPAIDVAYFPNTGNTALYWSSNTHASDGSFAWYVRFTEGFTGTNRGSALSIRLVRGAP